MEDSDIHNFFLSSLMFCFSFAKQDPVSKEHSQLLIQFEAVRDDQNL